MYFYAFSFFGGGRGRSASSFFREKGERAKKADLQTFSEHVNAARPVGRKRKNQCRCYDIRGKNNSLSSLIIQNKENINVLSI